MVHLPSSTHIKSCVLGGLIWTLSVNGVCVAERWVYKIKINSTQFYFTHLLKLQFQSWQHACFPYRLIWDNISEPGSNAAVQQCYAAVLRVPSGWIPPIELDKTSWPSTRVYQCHHCCGIITLKAFELG